MTILTVDNGGDRANGGLMNFCPKGEPIPGNEGDSDMKHSKLVKNIFVFPLDAISFTSFKSTAAPSQRNQKRQKLTFCVNDFKPKWSTKVSVLK